MGKMFLSGCSLLNRAWLAIAFFLTFHTGTASAVVPIFKNDFKTDQPGSVIEITDIKGVSLAKKPRMLIYPGTEKRLALRSVNQFTVSRIFPNKKELFMVECPQDDRQRRQVVFTYEILMSGQLPGDCIILRKGSWSLDKGREWDYVGVSRKLLTK